MKTLAIIFCCAIVVADDDLTDVQRARVLEHAPVGPAPVALSNAVADDPRAAHLGQFLFFDVRLSPSRKVSCATCHEPERAFTDGRRVAMGLKRGDRNAQTLLNVAHNPWFFWDGRADSLWAQAAQPIENERELGGSRLETFHLVMTDPDLRRAYEHVFGALPDPADLERFPPRARPLPFDESHPDHQAWIAMPWDDRQIVNEVYANICKCIAAYQRRLIGRNSPFDRYVDALRTNNPEGLDAISDEAKQGMKLFIGEANCRLCHSGPMFSDGLFHAGLVPPLGGGMPSDAGRYNAVDLIKQDHFNAAGAFNDDPDRRDAARLRGLHRDSHDWGAFRTPTLRNIALTAPYMHQGQLEKLDDVVRFYSTLDGALQRGPNTEIVLRPLNLDDAQQASLIAFLNTLTDEPLDPALLNPPSSPILHESD